MAPTPEHILAKYWGYSSFRPLQREIIESILSKNDTIAMLPTGGGKSLCYQLPAVMQDGMCLVISPLIALMQDQVSHLEQLGISAVCMHSGQNYHDLSRILDNAVQGAYKLLYISPERLQTRLFGAYMPSLDVRLIAVDEAHCISQWGHDFRPDYLKIAEARLAFPSAPVLALTASATGEVQSDIVSQLRFGRFNTFKESFARKNIYFRISYSENKPGDTLKQADGICSIVYCRSRRQTETVTRYLQQSGRSATPYHAGLSKEARDANQSRWMDGGAGIMVATTAFGMGIDKPGVRSVIHYESPEHLEAFYQEAGRAGRDGRPALSVLLYNESDIRRLQESTALQYPAEDYLRTVYQAVAEYLQVPIGTQPDQYFPFDLPDFCKKFSLQATHAVHALKLLEQEGLWTLTESVYHPATVQFIADRHTLDDLHFVNEELAYVTVGLLRMFNSIFHFPTPVRETAIARQLKMKKDELIAALQQLDKMELIRYVQPGEGPSLIFHHCRADSRHLIIDTRRINTLRKRHQARTDAMIGFLENTSKCRENILLAYFGERPTSDCGHCDVCTYKQRNRRSPAMLAGEIADRAQKAGPVALTDALSGLDAGTKEDVLQILRQMIDAGRLSFRAGMLLRKE